MKEVRHHACTWSSLALLILTLTIVSSGQNLNLKSWLADQQKRIRISSSVIEQYHCANGNISLQASITVKNMSGEALVFCRDCMTNEGIYVGRNLDSLFQNDFVYDLIGFSDERKFDANEFSPSKKPFVTVQAGGVFSFEQDAHLINTGRNKTALKNGKYTFVQTINTWSGSGEQARQMKEDWRKQGLNFWSDDIVTEPIVVRIEPTDPQPCE